MTGPYRARVWINVDPTRTSGCDPDLILDWETEREALDAGETISHRYYRSGGGATVLGTLRAATFYIGSILQPGETAYVSVHGRFASEGRTGSTGYDAVIERDRRGAAKTTLGSRWGNLRVFRGL